MIESVIRLFVYTRRVLDSSLFIFVCTRVANKSCPHIITYRGRCLRTSFSRRSGATATHSKLWGANRSCREKRKGATSRGAMPERVALLRIGHWMRDLARSQWPSLWYVSGEPRRNKLQDCAESRALKRSTCKGVFLLATGARQRPLCGVWVPCS
jgi:hypothetical protein